MPVTHFDQDITDVAVENHGSIFLFRPVSNKGRQWLHATAPEDAQWWGLALAVEHRYANEVAVCAIDAGLHVS